jgi:2,4-dienoyl-CoA reductase-like NADH-dependent reductase (Old Yellow Enzyme family)
VKKQLLDSAKIGVMELRNKIVMLPMATQYASDTGAVTERLIDYYVDRARGGVGLIIMGAVCVDSFLGKTGTTQLCIDNDKFIPPFTDLIEEVHNYDAKIVPQLIHAGRQVATLDAVEGRQPVSASDVPCSFIPLVTARALRIEEIECIVDKFVKAAWRASVAGFDGIELHGAHGNLIEQFISPRTNKRTDEYGGDLDGRIKFALDIVKRIKEKVGATFPIIFRLTVEEYIEGGITLEDAKVIAKKLEEAGVDAIDISAGVLPETSFHAVPPMDMARGCHVYLAEGIKKVVGVPVIASGRINDPLLAEEILQEGKADLIGMGRALIADPELPKKVAEGRIDEIRKCIACVQGCLGFGIRLKCAVNAAVGKERKYSIKRTEKSKKILVVGGGPAGMEAARVAALRGHEVILYEKNEKLGGQLLLAAVSAYKKEICTLIDYLAHEIKRLRVNIKLKEEVTPELVEEIRPDTVIVATGSIEEIPGGIVGNNVALARSILAGEAVIGDSIAVVGAGLVGCETAEVLAEKGKRVVLTTRRRLGDVASGMPSRRRILLLKRFAERKMKIIPEVKLEEVTDKNAVFIDKNWSKLILEVDAVVIAAPAIANRDLLNSLKNNREVFAIGDCLRPRGILEAIHEGYRIASEI